MNAQCDCRIHGSRARIQLPDGRVIATGLLKLGGRHTPDSFEPDAPSEGSLPLDTTAYPEVVAVTTSHRHVLRGWELCDARWLRRHEGRPLLVPHFHFVEVIDA